MRRASVARRMDRAWENLLIRTFGALALASLLMHGGIDARSYALPALYLVPFFLGSVVANWALARLNVKRAAVWTTTALLGGLPFVMPALHLGILGDDALHDGVLYAGSLFGLVTLALGLRILATRRKPGADEATE